MDRYPADDLIGQYVIQSQPYYRATGQEIATTSAVLREAAMKVNALVATFRVDVPEGLTELARWSIAEGRIHG